MTKIADERIISLVKPKYMEGIPSFAKKHATGNSCRLIELVNPDLYNAFAREEEPTEEEKAKMSEIINNIFETHMKHGHGHCHGNAKKTDKEG